MKHPRRTPWTLWTGALVAAALLGFAASVPAAMDGKAIFTAQKCETCHAVSKAGIESKTKSGKMFGGDLSAVIAKVDPAWATKFLKGEEKKDGQPHKKKVTASDAEIEALLAWLKTQAQ